MITLSNLLYRWRSLLVAIALAPLNLSAAETLVFDQPQLAGIAGFRPFWDSPITLAADGMTAKGEPFRNGDPLRAEWDPIKRKGQPGAIAFDALQRYALVRFPDAAEQIAAQVNKGFQIAKVELVLPWKATELFPPGNPGYEYRANWGVEDMWRKDPARWHAIAFALRRPWTADENTGPTFNAFINGAGYWAHCGARDTTKDRFPEQLGPAEVSYKSPEGRLDVTSILTNTAYGKTLGERLRGLSDCGFVLQKWETYDHRYFNGVYEWGTATGGRAILIDTPKLVVTLMPGKSPKTTVAPPVDIVSLANRLKSNGGGKPTAFLPSSEELAAFAAKFAGKPAWMPDWQWKRVQDLQNQGGAGKATRPYWYSYAPDHLVNWARERLQSQGAGANLQAALDREVFGLWVDQVIRKQPRGWEGFEASKEMNQWYIYGSSLPQPAKDAILIYWTAWLMPERKAAPLSEHLNPTNTTGQLIHPMADQLAKRGGTESYVGDTYHALTGDWRGNKSFYRSGFNYVMSTQNFNTSAAAGALLGGSIIGSEYAMEDGRHGMEYNLGRLWSWGGGTSQEYIDHYYFAITVSGYKAIADFGPSAFDRLMGEILLMKAMEELTGCYHAGLRRFIAGSSRTSLEYLLGKQDGLQYTLHTESQSGTLTDVGNQKGPFGAPLWGQERSSMDVARQTLNNPWLPDWALSMVDGKPFPFEVNSRTRDSISRGYLAENYGLAANNKGEGRIAFMGQWRREPRQVASYKDVVTMDLRYGINQTRWANDVPGWIAPIGKMASVQHKNKMIVSMSPWPADYIKNVIKKDGLKSLQASIGLFNFQEPGPTWDIFIDGQKVSGLPVKAKQGQKITIHDGVSYLAVIPLPGSNLGRQDEVVLREGDQQYFENDPKKQGYKATLVIDSYNLQTADATKVVTNWDPIDKAHAGFVIEMGDQVEWGSFEKFQQHIGQVNVTTAYDSEKDVVQITFKSGPDTLELGAYTKAESGAPGLIAFQRVNGNDATMAEGIDRDTTLSQQSRRGRAEKNGAAITLDAGRLAYLVTEPTGNAFAGFSPLSDLTRFAMTTPGGIKVEADGQVGLCRVVVQPKLNAVAIDYGWKPEQQNTPETVKAFLISGVKQTPRVTLNGQLVKPTLRKGVFVVDAKR